jgi:hypothetical protein
MLPKNCCDGQAFGFFTSIRKASRWRSRLRKGAESKNSQAQYSGHWQAGRIVNDAYGG